MERAKRRGELYAPTSMPSATGQLCREGLAWPWKGGFEVIALLPASSEEPAYRIRNAEQAYDRLVCEHELSEHRRMVSTSWTRSLN